MIPREVMKAGDVAWFGELSAGRVRVCRVSVRRKPRGRGGYVWLDSDAPKLTASQYELYRSEEETFRDLHRQAHEFLESAAADANAADAALADFLARATSKKEE